MFGFYCLPGALLLCWCDTVGLYLYVALDALWVWQVCNCCYRDTDSTVVGVTLSAKLVCASCAHALHASHAGLLHATLAQCAMLSGFGALLSGKRSLHVLTVPVLPAACCQAPGSTGMHCCCALIAGRLLLWQTVPQLFDYIWAMWNVHASIEALKTKQAA